MAPERIAGGWIGRSAKAESTRVLIRAFGARELALAIGALVALRRAPGEASGWMAAHAVSDGTDLIATLAARDDLPPNGFRFATAVAGVSTLIASAGALTEFRITRGSRRKATN